MAKQLMAELHEQMMKAQPYSDDAAMLKTSFHAWWSKLSLHDRTVGSADVIKQATERITAFRTVNGSAPFGAEPARATLRPGMTHADVNVWQGILNIPKTGKMDPKTVEETKAFQKVHGTKPDGVVGPATWALAPSSAKGKVSMIADQGISTAVAIVAGTTIGVVLASAAIGVLLGFLI